MGGPEDGGVVVVLVAVGSWVGSWLMVVLGLAFSADCGFFMFDGMKDG